MRHVHEHPGQPSYAGITKLALVIFDLDGTLIDSEPNYFAAEQRLLAEIGILDFDEAAKGSYVGRSTREILASLAGQYGITESVDLLAARKDAYYLDLAYKQTKVFTRMEQFLALQADQGYRLALASGSSTEAINAVMGITGLGRYFELAVSADAVPNVSPNRICFSKWPHGSECRRNAALSSRTPTMDVKLHGGPGRDASSRLEFPANCATPTSLKWNLSSRTEWTSSPRRCTGLGEGGARKCRAQLSIGSEVWR